MGASSRRLALGKQSYQVLVLSACALTAGALLVCVTPRGVGLSPDSAVYVGAARSLLRGEGVSLPTSSGAFAPVVHYPPLYPALLMLLSLTGVDAVAAARWLNALLFSANIFLAGWIALAATRWFRISVYAAALTMTAFPMVQVHTMAWSEPLFILFELCGSLFLLWYLQDATYRNLGVSSIAIGLSAFTRYAGIALLVSGCISILLFSDGKSKTRIIDAVIFGIVGSLPVVFWTARNWLVASNATNRDFGFHPIGLEHLSEVVIVVLSWISIPLFSTTGVQVVLIGLLVLGGLAILLGIWRERRDAETLGMQNSLALPMLMLSTMVVYFLMLFATISFLDDQTQVDSRILAPVYVALMLLGVSFSNKLLGRRETGKRSQGLLLAVALIFLSLQAMRTWPWLSLTYRDGVGYASRQWAESEIVRRVKLLEPLTPLFSNAPDVLYTLVGRPARMIPRKVNPDTRRVNHEYQPQLAQMKRNMKTANGVLVYFDQVRWRWYLPDRKELEEAIGVRSLYGGADGSIYSVD